MKSLSHLLVLMALVTDLPVKPGQAILVHGAIPIAALK